MTRLFPICGLAVLISLFACGGSDDEATDNDTGTEQEEPAPLDPDDAGVTPPETEADAGTPPAPSLCPGGGQPAAEVCDGTDNDCDGATDEGCPSGISTVAGTDGPPMGSLPGGSPVTAFCPVGQVITGFSTTRIGTNGVVGNLEFECGKLTLNTNTNVKPYTFSISFPLGQKGKFGAVSPSSLFHPALHRCPTGQAIMGLRYHSNPNINATLGGMRCGSLTVTGAPAKPVLTRKLGADTTFSEVVPSATAIRSFFDCAGTGFVSGFTGRAGAFTDAMRASCSNPSLSVK